MTAKISAEEKAIIEYVESNSATPIDDVGTEKKRYTTIAQAQMDNSIRLLESDIERIKA